MNKKEVLNQIKDLLKFNQVDEKFLDAKLEDGETIVRVDADDFAKDLPIMIVTEEGTDVLTDGTYTLEDGRVLEVVEGVISSITVTEEEEVVEEIVEELSSDVTEEEEVEEVVEEEVVEDNSNTIALETRIEQLEEMLKEMLDNQSNTATAVEMMSKVIVDLGGNPADTEPLNIKSNFSSQEKKKNSNTIDSKLEEIRNIRRK